MTLRDIGVYKNRILTTIVKSDDICDLILGDDYNRDNKEDIDTKLIYEYIFPYLYIDDEQTSAKTYVCIEVSVPRTHDFTYKDMQIDILCYCHKDIMQYYKAGYSGTRADIITDMVDRLLNSSNNYGVGRLKLKSVVPANVSKTHYGWHMIYTCAEFNIDKKL